MFVSNNQKVVKSKGGWRQGFQKWSVLFSMFVETGRQSPIQDQRLRVTAGTDYLKSSYFLYLLSPPARLRREDQVSSGRRAVGDPSERGPAHWESQGYQEHQSAIRRWKVIHHCLLYHGSLGHHGGAVPLPWRIWCVHGKQNLIMILLSHLKISKIFTWAFVGFCIYPSYDCSCLLFLMLHRTWWIAESAWSWCWSTPRTIQTDSLSSSLLRTWG